MSLLVVIGLVASGAVAVDVLPARANGANVSIEVVDSSNAPVAGVAVFIESGDPAQETFCADTDASGAASCAFDGVGELRLSPPSGFLSPPAIPFDTAISTDPIAVELVDFFTGSITVSGTISAASLQDVELLLNFADDILGYYTVYENFTGAENGTFSYENLPAGSYQLEVVGGGHLRWDSGEFELTANQTFSVDLIATSQTITGTVTDDAGNPVSGATVSAVFENEYSSWTNFAATDANGTYTFTSVPAAIIDLGVQADGFLPLSDQSADVTSVSPLTKDFTLSNFLGSGNYDISGTVTAGGNPLSGVSVELQSYDLSGSGSSVIVTTDADGDYLLAGVPAGNYGLTIFEEGYLTWSSYSLRFSDLSDRTFSIDLVEAGSGTLTGTVTKPVGDTEEPVAGATVDASFFLETSGGSFYWSSSVTTGNDGSYTMTNVPAETISVSVRHDEPGFFTNSAGISVDASSGTAEQDIELVPLPEGNFTLSGTIRDLDGQVRGAGAGLYLSLNDWENGSASYTTTVDGQGRFTFSNIGRGEYSLFLDQISGFLSWSANFTVNADRVVNIVLTPTGSKTISGTVVNSETSEGIPEVSVWAYADINGSYWSSSNNTVTDENGQYLIEEVPAGDVEVYIEAPDGYFESWDQVTVDTTGSSTSFTQGFSIEPLPSGTQTISGTVTKAGESGPSAALDGVTVYLSYSTFGTGSANRYYSTDTVTTDGGTYEFTNLWPGQYWLWADCYEECSGYDSAWGSARLSQDGGDVTKNFAMRPLPPSDSSLTLTVKEAGSNTLIQGVEISITNESFSSINAYGRTDANGVVTFEDLPAGTYTYYVNASDPNFTDWRPLYEYPSYSESFIRVSGVTAQDVSLTPISYENTRDVSGTLIDQRTNEPIAAAQVSLSADGLGFWTATETNGEWSVPSVPAGKYWVSAYIDSAEGLSYTFVYDEVDVPEGAGTFTVALGTRSLAPGSGSVTAVLRDKATHARVTSNETVTLSHESANFFREADSVNGEVTFTDLPPGGYYLSAESSGYLFDEGAYVTVGQTGDTLVNFRGEKLNRAGSLTVNVSEFVAENDTPGVEGAWISIAVVPTDPTDTPQYVADLYGQTDDSGQIVFGKGTGEYSDIKLPVGRQLEITVDVSLGPDSERPGGLVPHTERFSLTAANSNDLSLDVLLMPGGSLSGKVSVPTGQTPIGLYVSAFDVETDNWVGWGDVELDGQFTINSLPAGDYLVLVEDFRTTGDSIRNAFIGGDLVPTSSPTASDQWTVTSGETTFIEADLDDTVDLVGGATVSGVVNVSIDGSAQDLPIGRWISIEVLDNQDPENPTELDVPVYGWTSGFDDGEYTIRGLAPGDYLLRFVDGFTFSDGFSTSSRLYETVDLEVIVPLTGSLTNQNVTMSVEAPDANRATAFVIDANTDLEDGIGVDSSLTIASTVEIQLPVEMAGEWVLPVANSTAVVLREAGADNDGWVQVRADGTVAVQLPESLAGSHKIGVKDADDQLVGWSSVSISDTPAPSSRPSKAKEAEVEVVPAEEVQAIRQWLQNPTGPRPTDEDGSPLTEETPEPPVADAAPEPEEAPAAADEGEAVAASDSGGLGTLLWWVLGIVGVMIAIAAVVLFARRRFA